MPSNDTTREPLIRKRQNQKNSSKNRTDMEARAEHKTRQRFKLLYGISSVIGGVLAVLVLLWCIYFRGGFTWQSNPKVQFNWHPLLMILGLICLYSQSILIYRTGQNLPKKTLKLIHTSLHLLVFILVVIALKASFDSHNLVTPPIPNLYTLHSWIGLVTVIFFAIQFVMGFTAFLFPGYPMDIRAAILPAHVHVGKAIFFFATVAGVTGMMEKAIWAIPDYKDRSPEAFIVNFMGLILVIFSALILYLINEPEYKRVAKPEDQLNLGDHSE